MTQEETKVLTEQEVYEAATVLYSEGDIEGSIQLIRDHLGDKAAEQAKTAVEAVQRADASREEA